MSVISNGSMMSPKNAESINIQVANGVEENKRNNSQFFIDLKALSQKFQQDINSNDKDLNPQANQNTTSDKTGFSTSNIPYIPGPPLDDPLMSNTSLQLL